jgi:hypothetical protein
LWTGDEVIFLGGMRSTAGGGGQPIGEAASYDPATNEWRRLADAPGDSVLPYPQAVWTGASILTTLETFRSERVPTTDSTFTPFDFVLARYDLATDTWHIVDDEVTSAVLVGIPDAGGAAATVAALDFEVDAPIDLLDDSGNVVGDLPGRPVSLPGFGNLAQGVWVGDEALFWMGGARGWAFNPATHTWRSFPAGDVSGRVDGALIAAGDVLLAWGGFVGGPPVTEASDGIVYRSPGPAGASGSASGDPAQAPATEPPVVEAPPVADLLGLGDAVSPDAEPVTLDVPELGWTLSFRNGWAEVTDATGTPLGSVNRNGPANGSILMGPVGAIPPPSGRWTIAVVSTAPRIAVLSQPDDAAWALTEPTTMVSVGGGRLYVYVVDGGPWSSGFNTIAYPA